MLSESRLEDEIHEEKKAETPAQSVDITSLPIEELEQGICYKPEGKARGDATRQGNQYHDQEGGEPFREIVKFHVLELLHHHGTGDDDDRRDSSLGHKRE